jgi:succinate-semialdehyde dehydrogenase/glutarate-semialdehyde dehydrogenase
MSFVWNTYNPATESVLNTFTHLSEEELETKLAQATTINKTWADSEISVRIDALIQFAGFLRNQRRYGAELMALEMGKPITQGLSEIDKCVATCEYYAEHVQAFLSSEELTAHYKETWILKRPLGTILAIMPWNFPFWQVIRFAAPALLVGNTVILKHAPSVQGIAVWLEKLFLESFKLPVLLQLPISIEQTERVLADSRVQAVTFTGSTAAGRKIAAIAGAHLKKCVLELGGSDPYIVLADAHIEEAADFCVKARFINSGQSCIAAKRFFVHQAVYSVFIEVVKNQMASLKIGSPMLEDTQIGPLSEERIRTQVINQIQQSVELGAEVLLGGHILDGPGFFMQPTLMQVHDINVPIMNQEVFGPVMPIKKVESDEQALHFANDSEYGLGAAIFSKDREKSWCMAVERLNCGVVAINGMVSSDPRVPFGGVKNSGFGRELGLYGLLEFVNIKTIGIN